MHISHCDSQCPVRFVTPPCTVMHIKLCAEEVEQQEPTSKRAGCKIK